MPPVWTDLATAPRRRPYRLSGLLPWGEAHLGDYLGSTHKPTACDTSVKDQGVTPEG